MGDTPPALFLGLPRRTWALVLAYITAYFTWQALRWIPGPQDAIGNVWFVPLGAIGTLAAWRAAGRAGTAVALRRGWRLLAVAWLAYVTGDLIEATYGMFGTSLPYPSLVDAFELAFYPLAFAGVLWLPTRRSVRSGRAPFALDLVIVALGAGTAAWYFVIGPYIGHDGQPALQYLVTLAYPLGDGLLAIALVSRVLRGATAQTRNSLALMCAGIAVFIVADLTWLYTAAHGIYVAGGPDDEIKMLAEACMVLAALAQHAVPATDSVEPSSSNSKVQWFLPYAAVILGFVLLLRAERHDSFFPEVSLVLAAAALAALMIARQLVAARWQHRVQRQQRQVAVLGRHGLRSGDLDGVLEEGVALAASELDVELCSVFRAEPDGETLRLVAAFGWPKDAVNHLTIPAGAGTTTGSAFVADAPVVLSDLRRDGRFPGAAYLRELGVLSGVITPIHTRDGRFGLLAAHSTRVRRFSIEEVAFLDAVSGVLGAAAERAAADDQIRRHAMYDWLTGLPNRLLFTDRLRHALAAARRDGQALGLLYIDLDRFKHINDSLGHGVGDEVLRRIAARLSEQMRPGDTLARLGGDEFAVVLPALLDGEAAASFAERLLKALLPPLALADGRELLIGASIGVALADPRHGTTSEALERNADLAMYASKNAGRGQVRSFEPAMHERTLRQLELSGDLHGGVDREEFELRYQPIVSLAAGEVVAVEALVRWNHPEHGLLGPAEFIELAEQTGLIVAMGRYILRESCAQLGRWREQFGVPDLAVSVNVSVAQLASRELVADVAEALALGGLPASRLILEITESVLMEGDGIEAQLARLHDLGVRLAIDDFGTGYSSLGYLHRYPFDILKIDRSFIDTIGVSEANDKLVRGIVSLAHSLALETIAEGVERPEQARALEAMSAGLVQGYYYSPPLHADDIAPLLAGAGAIDALSLSG
jgi:diguanylate cyclase (GGDEF)-like protein